MPSSTAGAIQLFCRPCITLSSGANICAVLDASYVRRMRTRKERVWALFSIQFNKGAGIDHLLAKAVVFLL
jgi:hypothetical protein